MTAIKDVSENGHGDDVSVETALVLALFEGGFIYTHEPLRYLAEGVPIVCDEDGWCRVLGTIVIDTLAAL